MLVIAVWLLTGPTFHFSDTWQLIINTATTIITFLMVFLIQNTQNRDAKAVHLKLDEMIRALKGARNKLVDLEDLSDEELKKLEEQFQRLRKKAEHNGTRSRRGRIVEVSLEQTLLDCLFCLAPGVGRGRGVGCSGCVSTEPTSTATEYAKENTPLVWRGGGVKFG